MRTIRLLVGPAVVLAGALASLPLGTALLPQDQPDKTSDTVYALGDGVSAPRGIYMPNPQYTESARKKKLNGNVTLAMIVTAEGKVRELRVTKSLDEGLDKQALAAVSTWRFEPAIKDGKPVAVHLGTDVTFRLY